MSKTIVYEPPPDDPPDVETESYEPEPRGPIKHAAEAFRKEFGGTAWFHNLLMAPDGDYLIVVVNAAYYPGAFRDPKNPDKTWNGWPITVAKLPKLHCSPPKPQVHIGLEQVMYKLIGAHAHEPWFCGVYVARSEDHLLLYVDRRKYPKDSKSHWIQDSWPVQVVYPSTKWIDRQKGEQKGQEEFPE